MKLESDHVVLPSLTARAFAVFLRFYPSEWRIRRVDRVEPLHFHLAAQQTTLDFVITPELAKTFIDRYSGGELTLADGSPLQDWAPTKIS